MFVGYLKGTRGGLFYSPQKKKIFVSTNATFLETNYMTNYKPRSNIVLKELLYDHIKPQSTTVIDRQSEETTTLNQDILPP